MALSDEDVREILRIIDESELSELRIDTEGFSLHVVRGDHGASTEPTPRPRKAPTATRAPEPPPAEPADGLVTVPAPILGTFYRAEAPGKPPFVDVGSRVEPDTIVCIIEVMKMMNSVPAGVAGTVAEILPDNAELVEYGQPLVRVQVQPA
jgi:acetyl-CoA carboxylase biotin carboxyl carrier protein